MIRPFFQGLYAYYKASGHAFYTLTGGRFYFQTAPPNAAKPYVTVWDIGTDGVDNWFTHQFEEQRIQISIYSNVGDESLTLIGQQAKSLFDNAVLTVSGWSLISFDRKNEYQPGILYDEESKDWQYPIIYRAKLQRART